MDEEEGIELGAKEVQNPVRTAASRETWTDRRRDEEPRQEANELEAKPEEFDEEQPPPAAEDGFEKILETAKEKRLVRKQQRLRGADFAGMAVIMLVTASVISFQVLCVSDQQCFANGDPAVPKPSHAIVPLLAVCVLVVAPMLLWAASAAREVTVGLTEKRPLVIRGLVISLVFGLVFLSLASERGDHLRNAKFRRRARRLWRRCEDEADPSGVWKRRGDCNYPNTVRLFYVKHENIAEQARDNLEHLLYALLAMFAIFLMEFLGLASAMLFASSTPPTSLLDCGDCLRLRPRLVQRGPLPSSDDDDSSSD